MKATCKTEVPLFIKIFFAADFIIAFVYIFEDLVFGKPIEVVSRFLRIGYGANLPAWYASVQLFLIAILLAVFAYHRFKRKDFESRIPVLVSILFFGLSLDKVSKSIELISRKLSVFFTSRELMEPIFLAVIMFIICIALFLLGIGARGYLRNKPHVLRNYLIGWTILIVSATVIESLQIYVAWREIFQQVKIFFHGLGEMLGATFLLWATYDLLISYGFSLRTVNEDPANHTPSKS